jgi:hypothetical protein
MLTMLADTDEGEQRRALASQVNEALSLHMRLEEELVYPLVAEDVGEEDREEGDAEHTLARNGLATMLDMVDEPGFGASVEMLKAGILHHVHEEETEVLPELKASLERSDWLALGDRLAEGKAAAGVPPAPPARRRSSRRKQTASARR